MAQPPPSTPVPSTPAPQRTRDHDGPPNPVENNRWKHRPPLSAGDHAAALTAAGLVRPELERLCRERIFGLDAARGVFTAAGYPANDVHVQPFTASADGATPPGVVYTLRLGDRACVMGHVRPDEVLLVVDGTNGEGTCIEARSH
ncbi:hypothetical protein [Saccharothrix hoggarensis]|uniref:Uncharacterized protein n=1 Tax=Saccharothrix hoggarensis TaxID=913853 RepID=A0ABW3QXC5_9PSEU